jgi:tripartite-type tricarboxylate transporter receptor subunit TctC
MNLLHVAYKGTGPAITDAIGGQIDMVMVPASALANVIRAGKLRGIAVLSTARSPILPDLPTLREHGLPEVHGETWYGMFAPTGTPPAIVNTLSAAAAEVLAQPDLVQILRTAGYEPGASTPAELAETVKADNARWGRVIAEAGIRLEQ